MDFLAFISIPANHSISLFHSSSAYAMEDNNTNPITSSSAAEVYHKRHIHCQRWDFGDGHPLSNYCKNIINVTRHIVVGVLCIRCPSALTHTTPSHLSSCSYYYSGGECIGKRIRCGSAAPSLELHPPTLGFHFYYMNKSWIVPSLSYYLLGCYTSSAHLNHHHQRVTDWIADWCACIDNTRREERDYVRCNVPHPQ